jgi:hypothetical protein
MQLNTVIRASLIACLTLLGTASAASELVYKPLHPAFGGDPNNFNALFNLAQIQNQFTAESGGGGAPAINFPPITIDLGGVGNTPDPADDPADDPAASTPGF